MDEMLYNQLIEKLRRQDDPEYQAREFERSNSSAAATDRNNLIASLAQSGAQIGSIGGKIADVSPVSDMAKGLNATNDRYAAMDSQDQARRDKRDQARIDLYERLKAKEEAARLAKQPKPASYAKAEVDGRVKFFNQNDPTQSVDVGSAPMKEKAQPKGAKWETIKDKTGPNGEVYQVNNENGEVRIVEFPSGSKTAGRGVPKPSQISGLEKIDESQPTLQDLETVKKSKTVRDNIAASMKYLDELAKGGPQMITQNADLMRATATDIKLQLKELQNLGVLNGPDLVLLTQQVPDPTTLKENILGAAGAGRYPAMSSQFKKAIDQKYQNTLSVRGYRDPALNIDQTEPSQRQSSGTAYAAPSPQPSNTVQKISVIDPDGKPALIFKDKLDAALKRGFTLPAQ